MPEGRLERTRRAYAEDPAFRESRRAETKPTCRVCGGVHSDGSVCAPIEPTEDALWGV
jgi:hypothetical protein